MPCPSRVRFQIWMLLLPSVRRGVGHHVIQRGARRPAQDRLVHAVAEHRHVAVDADLLRSAGRRPAGRSDQAAAVVTGRVDGRLNLGGGARRDGPEVARAGDAPRRRARCAPIDGTSHASSSSGSDQHQTSAHERSCARSSSHSRVSDVRDQDRATRCSVRSVTDTGRHRRYVANDVERQFVKYRDWRPYRHPIRAGRAYPA